MKINFILPFPPLAPGGGAKIMYEYANRLTQRGHKVVFYHSLKTSYFPHRKPYLLRLIYFSLIKRRIPTWFPLSPQIRSVNVPSVRDKYIEDGDIVVSSWWATAVEVNSLSPSKGKKNNLIQDYEVWTGHADKVKASYSLPGQKIVIANYLKDLVKKAGAKQVVQIPNGIDKTRFYLFESIENRFPRSIAMMFSEDSRKNSPLGLIALTKLKELYADLRVTFFSSFPKPEGLPNWITFYQKPNNLNEIYNSSSIYLTPALQEGWALPPAEAMTCGCALVCSDIPGHADYGSEGVTAIKFNPYDVNHMIDSLRKVLDDNSLRIKLAKNGNLLSQQFDWDVAVTSLEQLFLGELQN